jgi:hypothetical protein
VGTGADSPGVKRPGREADHSPVSSAEVNNGGGSIMVEIYIHSPIHLRGIMLNKLSTGTTLPFYCVKEMCWKAATWNTNEMKDNIKIDFKEIIFEYGREMKLAQDHVQW